MAVERFEEHRDLLAGAAYRILGSVTDAEDVVQEAWLRWPGVDVQEGRPRFEVDRGLRRRLTERFAEAAVGGDPGALTAMPAEDASLVGDGGGRVKVPLRVVTGARGVARWRLPACSARSPRPARRSRRRPPCGPSRGRAARGRA